MADPHQHPPRSALSSPHLAHSSALSFSLFFRNTACTASEWDESRETGKGLQRMNM